MGCPQSHISDMFSFLPSRLQRRRLATVSVHTQLRGGSFHLTSCVKSPSLLTARCREQQRLFTALRNVCLAFIQSMQRGCFGVDINPSTPSVAPHSACPAPFLISPCPRVLSPLPRLSPSCICLEEVVILSCFLCPTHSVGGSLWRRRWPPPILIFPEPKG